VESFNLARGVIQPSLFDVCRPLRPVRERSLSARSRRSGLEASRPHAGRQAQTVLRLLAELGPCTDHTLAAAAGLALASAGRARFALVARGDVRAFDRVEGRAGASRTRWTLTGRR
jgi:hypothetical protein